MFKIRQNLEDTASLTSNETGSSTPFAQISLDVIEDANISAGAFRLYTLLIALSRGFGSCWPSQATLAARLSVSLRTIRNWLKELETAGLIEIEHRCSLPGQEQSNLYRLKKLVPRQSAGATRQDISTSPGKIFSPPPARDFRTPRQDFAAESHKDLHENLYKHTSPESFEESSSEEADAVCMTNQTEKTVKEQVVVKSGDISPRIDRPELTQEKAKAAPKPELSPEKREQFSAICASLEKYGVAAERARSLARKLVTADKDNAYVEAWAEWISQQPTTRNVAAYLVRMLEQLAPVPLVGQSPASPPAKIEIDPGTARMLPRLIEIAQRDVEESRCERDLQSALARLERYRTMESQLKATQSQEGEKDHANFASATRAS